LVPVTFVTYAFSQADPIITPQRIFGAFVVGGILGVLGASLLEAELLKTPSSFTYLRVGLIEEAVKLAALWLLTWRLPRYSARGGMVLGECWWRTTQRFAALSFSAEPATAFADWASR
jgi:hypothetical protein